MGTALGHLASLVLIFFVVGHGGRQFYSAPQPRLPPPSPLPQPFYGTVFNPCLKNDHVFYNNGRKIEKNLDLDTLPL